MRGGRAGSSQAREQQLDRARAQLGRRLADHGQPRGEEVGPLEVVEGDQRESSGTLSPRSAIARSRPIVMKLLPETTAVGGSGEVEQRVHRRAAPGRAASRPRPPVAGRTRARLLERHPVAAHALVGRAQPGDADRHRDPAVPEVDQVLDEPRRRLLVVAADLVERGVDEAVEQHDRHALGLEVRQRVLQRADGRREQHPVDLALGQRAHDPQLVLGVLARVAQQQRVAGAPRGGLDRGHDVGEVGVREPADRQPERLRPAAGQRAGDRVRAVARALDRGQHAARASCSLAGRVPLMTCETVVTETPASRATSAIVTTARG